MLRRTRVRHGPDSSHIALGPGVPDPPSEAVPSATPRTRHRIGEPLGVRAGSVLGGLHHEYLLAPALA